MYDRKEDKEVDSHLYIPRLLYLRMTRRKILRYLSILSFLINSSLFILGFIFLDCVYNTRSYIPNGDYFWDAFQVKNLSSNQIQIYCSFTAVYTILSSFFLNMNNVVIFYHAHFGGLRKRLTLAKWINKLLQAVLFIYSIIPIVVFSNILILFPIYIALNGLAEVISVFIFILCGKVFRKELVHMLPYELMVHHKDEYYQEYLTKKKAIINLNNKAFFENEENRPIEAAHARFESNDKIFMNNN